MKSIFLQAGKDAFWNLTVSQMHTVALRAGYIIPTKEWDELVSQAKACFFIVKVDKVKKRTDNNIVNIAIALYKDEELPTIYNS